MGRLLAWDDDGYRAPDPVNMPRRRMQHIVSWQQSSGSVFACKMHMDPSFKRCSPARMGVWRPASSHHVLGTAPARRQRLPLPASARAPVHSDHAAGDERVTACTAQPGVQ